MAQIDFNTIQLMKIFETINNPELKNFLSALLKTPYFNSASFNNLYDDTNEPTVLKMLAHFEQNIIDSEIKMINSQGTHDTESIWKAAHKMTGSAELLGFSQFSKTARQLSNQLRANPDYESNHESIENFEHHLKDLRTIFSTYFPSLKNHL